MPHVPGGWRVSAFEIAGDTVTDLLHDSAPCTLRDDASGYTHVVLDTHKGRGATAAHSQQRMDSGTSPSLREKDTTGDSCNTSVEGGTASSGTPSIEVGSVPSSNPSIVVNTASEAIAVIVAASRRRSTHATGVHDSSSRTHAVYRLQPCITRAEGTAEGTDPAAACRSLPPDEGAEATDTAAGCLSLVDLAGSEWSRDQALHEKDRRKEAQEVNTSLSVLKACLAAREAGAGRRMPARDTALTRVLRGALEGSGRMVLIATVSPTSADAEHAMDTLCHVGLRLAPSVARAADGGSGDGGKGGSGKGAAGTGAAGTGDGGNNDGRLIVGGAAAESRTGWEACGAHVLTRRLQGAASLTRGEGGVEEDGDRALPRDPRQWTSAEVVRWWLDTASEAVKRINAEQTGSNKGAGGQGEGGGTPVVGEGAEAYLAAGASTGGEDANRNATEGAAGQAHRRLLVILNGAEWPPRTKLGLSFEPAGAGEDVPLVLSRAAPGTPITQASPLIRPGARLLNCEVTLTGGLAEPVPVGDEAGPVPAADATDGLGATTLTSELGGPGPAGGKTGQVFGAEAESQAAPLPFRRREEILAELRRAAHALCRVADALDEAKTEAIRAHEEVRVGGSMPEKVGGGKDLGRGCGEGGLDGRRAAALER
jgi:kinesin family protein 2/24